MKVQTLVEEYKNLSSMESEDAFIISHITQQYINYEQKLADIDHIVNLGNHVKIQDPTDTDKVIEIFKRNTSSMHYLLELTFLKNYSDIEIDEDGLLSAYNQLESVGFIDNFIKHLPQSEVKKYYSMLETANDDIYLNERDIPSYLDSKMGAITSVMEIMLSSLEELTEKMES